MIPLFDCVVEYGDPGFFINFINGVVDPIYVVLFEVLKGWVVLK